MAAAVVLGLAACRYASRGSLDSLPPLPGAPTPGDRGPVPEIGHTWHHADSLRSFRREMTVRAREGR